MPHERRFGTYFFLISLWQCYWHAHYIRLTWERGIARRVLSIEMANVVLRIAVDSKFLGSFVNLKKLNG